MGHTSERKKHAIYGQTTVHTLPGKHAVQPDDKTDCYAEYSQTIGHTDSRIAFKEKKRKTQYMCFISQLFMHNHRPASCSLLSPQCSLTVCNIYSS